MTIFNIITLLGGLAMFLYGMEIMGDGLKNSSGAALKKVLEKVTQNAIMGVLTGTLVTAVIQSSTATIVLTVGLLSAGILNLRQAASIVIGANIGTTVTAQIIRLMDLDSRGNMIIEFFKPSTLAPIALVIGIILIMFIKKRSKGAGEIAIGFGVLFTGLLNMTAAVEPLAGSAAFADLLGRFSQVPVLGILAGLGLTVIVQSSSAMVGMLQALSSTGAMTFSLVYPVIMGINLGTCVTTAMVCSIGSSTDAKRVGMVHILFNSVGTVVFMIAMTIMRSAGLFADLWGSIVNSGDIANFQTLFNLMTAVLLVPFSGLLVKASMLIVRSKRELKNAEYSELETLSERLYVAPTMAISEATKAIGAMGAIAKTNLNRSLQLLSKYDAELAAQIDDAEEHLDVFTDGTENFLVGLSRHVESDDDNQQINMLMQTLTDFERIGDYATNIQELAEKLSHDGFAFSEMATEELRLMCEAVTEISDITIDAFLRNDNLLAERVEPLEEVIDDMVAILKERHVDRLKAGKCTINTGLVFVETLTYLERASDQCSSIALLMLARDDSSIKESHHEYLRELHKGARSDYNEEIRLRRKQYLEPLAQIGG